ncbi:MAG: hypothetical protein COA42_21930 [Alteromonadaceae bacterium]|nr:MAG: hypothetical protein COA42_21930 [Alteromonadaceae bacterium]
MSSEKYDLVFNGEAVKGVSIDTAKQNLAKLFKLNAVKVETLFTGKPVTLKRNLDLDTANKYRVAIKKAGARVNLVEQQGSSAATPSSVVTVSSAPTSSSNVPPKGAPAPSKAPAAKKISTVAIGLAPAGTPVLAAEERQLPVDSTVNDVDFGLRPAGELLDGSEKKAFTPLNIDLSSMDLAPVGADVLKPEERLVVPKVSVNTSAMNLAEPGARLGEVEASAPPPPSTAHLHLEGEV